MTLLRTHSPLIRAILAALLVMGATAVLAACGDNIRPEVLATVDPTKSTVELVPETGARADGVEYVIVRVTVRDSAGAPLARMGVSLDASGDGNDLTQPPMNTGADGVALGSIRSIYAGHKEVQVTVTNGVEEFTLADRPVATFTPVASRLAFFTQPADSVAGERLPTIQVAIQDNLGTLMSAVTGPITLALQDNPTGARLFGTLTVDAVDGIAVFDHVLLLRAGAGYTIVASTPGLESAVSDAFAIVPAAPASLRFVGQPTDVVAGEAIAPAVAVEARDLFLNVATNATGTVAIALHNNPTGAALGGTVVRHLIDGVATFHDLAIDRVGPAYSLFAGFGTVPYAYSDAFDVTAAPVATLDVLGLADPFTAGGNGVLIVIARDRLGNVILDFDHTIAVTSTDSHAVLPANYAFRAEDHGWHAFTGVSLRTAGVQTITVTSQTDATLKGQRTVLVMPAAATTLAFTGQPTNGRSGTALSPAVAVTLRDPYGNAASESHQDVTLTIGTGPTGAALVGGGPRPPVTGVVTFGSVKLDKAGSYTLTATAAGCTAATSASFAIAAGDPATLGFVAQPTDVVAGTSITPAVQVGIFDAAGNPVASATDSVALAIQTGPSGAVLTGIGATAAVAGVATFAAVQGTTTGTYTLRATSGALTAAVSAPFDLEPAAGAKLAFLTAPTSAVAGVALSPAVRVAVEDEFGNLLPTATNAVSLAIVTSPAGGAILGGGPIAAVAGVATFPAVTFQRAGGYTIRATAAGGLQSAASAQFTISPAALAGLAFITQPTNTSPNTAITPAVQVALQDAFGNTLDASSPSIALQLTGGDATAVLTGGAATAPVAGVATFAALSIDKPGGDYLLAAAASGLTTGYSTTFAVFGPPHHVAFTTQPTNNPVDGTFTVAAAIQDVSGATITTDSTSQVTLAIDTNPGGGTLGGTLTRTAANGVATFTGLSLNEAGTGYTLRASSGALTDGVSNAFTIYGPAARLEITASPAAPVAADAVFTVQVTVQDSAGRRVENATNAVTVVLDTYPTGATLLGTTSQAAVAGVASFGDLRLRTAGDSTLKATAASLTDADPVSLTVTPLAAAALAVTDLPATYTAGDQSDVTVTARDQFGNVATSYTGTVHFTSSDGTATLPANYTFVAGDQGIRSFSNGVVLKTAGSQSVTATDTVTASITGAQATVVTAAAATGYSVTPISSAVAGALKSVTVAVKDPYNNTVTTYTNTIRFTSTDTTATLPADYTFQAGDAGTRTFTDALVFRKAGSQSLTVAEQPGAAITSTQALQVLPAAASKLGFVVQPVTTPVATAIAPAVQVAVQDQYANTLTSDSASQVVLALHAGAPAGAVLGGTLTRTVVNGVATFDDLTIDVSASGYQLDATSGSLTAATSTAFDVYATPAERDLVISEIMHMTGGQRLRQWFEVHNVSGKVLAVNGLDVDETTSAQSFSISTDTYLMPGEYYVFGASNTPADNGGVTTVDFVYPGTLTLPTVGHLVLSYGSVGVIDEVQWDSSGVVWPHTADRAMNLSSNAQGGDGSHYPWWWCDATTALPTTGYGTPGAPNVLCGTAASEPLDLCRLQSPVDIAALVAASTPVPVAGRVGEAGVTTRDTCNDFYPFVEGEVGWGAPASDPTSAWTWATAGFDPNYTGGACVAGEDQFIGDATFTGAGPRVFGYRFRLIDPTTQTAGAWTYCDRNGIAATPAAGAYGTVTVTPQVVISQVYGASNSAGPPVSTYQNDFVELHNRGITAVSLVGWSIQYASATGTGNFAANAITPLTKTIQPGAYYLVQMAGGTANGAPLPTPDDTGSLNMGGTGGKVILANTTTGLACNGGSTVCSAAQLAQILDLVGYGNANFYEGAGAAPAPSNILADVRGGSGCTDTNVNSADFATATPAARNSATTPFICP
jgi:hypothetical protein